MSSTERIRVLSLCLSIIFSCFNYGFSGLVTGTLIATTCGLIPVEKLNVGDKVLSYDISTQNPEDALFEVSITKIDKHLVDTIFGIITENENWLDVSPQQLFFTFKPADTQSGNTAIVDFVQAQYLTIKDMLIDINMSDIPIIEIHKTELNGAPAQQSSDKIKKNKNNKVVAVEERMVKVDVYSIEVEEPHTFLVADKSYFGKNESHHLFIAHNGLPVLGIGLSFAFGSTSASVSLAETTLTAGGIGAKFGPTGVAFGVVTGLGIWGYQYFFGDKKKDGTFYLERAGQNGNPNGNDPEDPKDKNNRKIPPPPPLGKKNDKENNVELVEQKVKSFEQARNKALDSIGDLGANSKPYTGRIGVGKGKIVGRQSADGKARWRLDYDPDKGPHINVEDFRNGKSVDAKKIAFPFEGDERTVESLLKHLNE